MQLGVMTRVFDRPTIQEVAAAIRAAGLSAVQLDLQSAGLEELPARLDGPTADRVRHSFERAGVTVSAVSGTFNAIDPDREHREEAIRRFGVLAAHCRRLGTRVVTLCTGTRDPGYMWRYHPDNSLPDAWADCVATMRALVRYADDHDLTLAFEPEVVNVVDTAEKSIQLIEEVGSPRLRIVMDPANYFHPSMLPRMREVLEETFALVGGYIALAHAKDVRGPEEPGGECIRPAAGQGGLDYPTYLRLLRESGYAGGLIMHSLSEAEVPASKAHVERYLWTGTRMVG